MDQESSAEVENFDRNGGETRGTDVVELLNASFFIQKSGVPLLRGNWKN